jgi:hypothetical protein
MSSSRATSRDRAAWPEVPAATFSAARLTSSRAWRSTSRFCGHSSAWTRCSPRPGRTTRAAIAYNRIAGVVVTGNEDGAHHVISEVAGGLVDIGYTVPGPAWTYGDKGPGLGDEEWLTTDEREWSIATGRTAAQNVVAGARGVRAWSLPSPGR